jgi:CHRD domain
MHALRCSILCLPLLGGCGSSGDHPVASPADQPKTGAATAQPASTTTIVPAPPATGLDPRRGEEIGPTFESFMSPWQQEAEESSTPATTPAEFRSTAPSLTRAQREAAGHRGVGQIRFRNDLSRAFVDVKIEGIDPSTINMFHIHCGKPGILGPILVDFALATDLQKSFSKGVLSVEVTDDLIVKTIGHSHSLTDAFLMGCFIPEVSPGSAKPPKVTTVSGMLTLARAGEIYFNLHTTGQTYYGDLRGQIYPPR